jgi:hypothetical protein
MAFARTDPDDSLYSKEMGIALENGLSIVRDFHGSYK